MQPDGAGVAFPEELDDARRCQDRNKQHQHMTDAPPHRLPRNQQCKRQRRQGRKHQPPLDQPAQGKQHADDRDPPPRRLVEPEPGQRHRGQDENITRHDVFADHRQQQDEAAAQMEHRRQRRDARAAGQAMDEGINDDRAEACPEGVEISELFPRHAAQNAERIEQAYAHAIEREEQIVRRVEARRRRVGDPGLGLDALVHAVGTDDVDVLQPADQAA